MKKVGLLFLLLFFCDLSAQDNIVKKSIKKITTIGNNTYITLNLYGDKPSNRYLTILLIIKQFEDSNKDLEIIHWNIEKQESGLDGYHIFGIWIQHKRNSNYKKIEEIIIKNPAHCGIFFCSYLVIPLFLLPLLFSLQLLLSSFRLL